MITIKDTLLHPYEIDVDRRNFTLIKLVAKQTDEGGLRRQPVGYWGTLGGCLSQIILEMVRARIATHDEMSGQVVTLKEFMQVQERQIQFMAKWMRQLDPISFGALEKEIPLVIPEHIWDLVHVTGKEQEVTVDVTIPDNIPDEIILAPIKTVKKKKGGTTKRK